MYLKSFFTFIICLSSLTIKSQERNILKVNDIERLEHFLKTTRSKDEFLLKKLNHKLQRLKQQANVVEMRKKIKEQAIQRRLQSAYKLTKKSLNKNLENKETKEFDSLMSIRKKIHPKKMAKMLSTLFDNDPNAKKSILLVENKSNCNFVLHIKGENNYKIAIPAHKQELITLKKGDYQLSGKVCKTYYLANKSIHKNIKITLQQ